jgi:hypothetical protein
MAALQRIWFNDEGRLMDAASYERCTERLRERLATDDAVLGLVALGSMAALDTKPDRGATTTFS